MKKTSLISNDILTEVEYEFDPAENDPSSTRNRDAGQGGYSRMHQEDTASDELRISLVLEDKYRRDIEDYDPDKGDLFSSRGLPAMGIEPWTYSSFRKRPSSFAQRLEPQLEEMNSGHISNQFGTWATASRCSTARRGRNFPAPPPGARGLPG